MSVLAIALAFAAGILTVLSPCVVPILPLVFGAAAGEHRLGPAAIALGLSFSFTAAGLFLATIGARLGLDSELLAPVFGSLLLLFGAVMLISWLRHRFELVLAPIANWGAPRSGAGQGRGLAGQFGSGALLGLVWSPCVGPTLGAASLLASQGKDLIGVAGAMTAFGIGAAIPLLVFGMLSRAAMVRARGSLITSGEWGRRLMGGGMLVIGLLVLTGLDHRVETALLDASPLWLTNLTTSV